MRFGSYNVRNLFLSDTPAQAGGDVKPGKELKALVGTINKVGAAVWCLQEVGSRGALEHLNAALAVPFPHLGWLPGNSDRGIHLAFLSRLPLSLTTHQQRLLTDADGNPLREYVNAEDARLERTQPLRFQRDVLLAELATANGATVAVFNTHLKSRANPDWRLNGADEVRAAEARELAGIVGAYQDTHPDRTVLLMGDFNDTRHSDALAPLRALYDPMGEQLARSRKKPSTYWPKRRMRIDLILVSPSSRHWIVDGSATIHASQMAERASDHFPVTLDLAL